MQRKLIFVTLLLGIVVLVGIVVNYIVVRLYNPSYNQKLTDTPTTQDGFFYVYKDCDADKYQSACGNLNCLNNEYKKYAFEIFKTAVTREHQISNDYFDSHFVITKADLRLIDKKDGVLASVDIQYYYQVGWIKRPDSVGVSFYLDKRENFDYLVSDVRRSISSSFNRYNVKDSDLISIASLQSLINKRYKGHMFDYHFCSIGVFPDENNLYNNLFRRTNYPQIQTFQLYGEAVASNNDCAYSTIDLFSGRRWVSTNNCTIE